ncbi:MAG: bacillithiol biosynthesis cysteine-adding enzyme BshC, partial [Robiginitalea sp.]
MQTKGIPFKETGYFSKLILDYLEQLPELKPFYGRFPTLDAFGEQLKEKAGGYPDSHRKVLCEVLEEQYSSLEISEATRVHLDNLQTSGTFTVVTGHQLNLFTGPLYFAYKILSTIKLTADLKQRYPDHDFVPVYWMATEDHDFEEINYFNFRGRKFRWNREAGGAVGRMKTDGLEDVFKQFSADLGPGIRADEIRSLFEHAYLQHASLAEATRYLANELFGHFGVVILDSDHPRLKELFIPFMQQDLFENLAFHAVSDSMEKLGKLSGDYPLQVNPRELNLFYLQEGSRSRLVEEAGKFGVLDSELRFTETELRKELQAHPERFSPNVITRPLYQEVLLPNLCYIGGGGELAYWLELKEFFQRSGVAFPILLLRNSALLISEKQVRKAANLHL